MTTRSITAKDVAARLGVSISTVGRALTDDTRISASTKAKVRRAAEELGYVANTPARVMRGGSSRLVGLVVPDIQNDFYATMAQALSKCCEEHGHHLALSIAADDPDIEAKQVKELVSARVAGVVIVPTATPRRETIALLSGVPRVQLLRRSRALGANWFGIDDEQCLRSGTAHLLKLGHRRIAYIGGTAALSTGASRVHGFIQAFKDARIDRSGALTELGPPTVEYGAAATERLLGSRNPPTALITGSVHITQGVLEIIRKLGIVAPGDLSIVAFGDPPWSRWWGPGLTTIRLPIQELATACGLWFLQSLTNKPRDDGPLLSTTQSGWLMVRGSTGQPKRTHVVTLNRGPTKRARVARSR